MVTNSSYSDKKFCLITGAAGGIGQALVKEFYEAGYHVIATDTNSEVPCNLSPCTWISADLYQFVECEKYAKKIVQKVLDILGDHFLNILVNNAAVQILNDTLSLSRDNWKMTLAVNLQAPFFLSQALLHKFAPSEGSIINISSIHSRLTKKNFVAYATSKAALSAMTRSMAVDLGADIRVNAIEPAAIDTEMLRAGLSSEPGLYKKLSEKHPVNRLGYPGEIAKIAYLIASSNIGFLTGSCISIDGGIGAALNDL